jgi:replicative superfamily II helicase
VVCFGEKLWNHREAIEKGYLAGGVSSAISFPTGGGKSTLAELKIASALLRQGKVVFLAPTHALVGQTTRALKRTFQTFDVLGDIDEDLNRRSRNAYALGQRFA